MSGDHYKTGEILAMYLLRPGLPNATKLAKLLGRSIGAVSFIQRQIENGAVIGKTSRAKNYIQGQLEFIEREFPPDEYKGCAAPAQNTAAKCMFCGKLPPVHHLSCAECGDVACFECIMGDLDAEWICAKCTGDERRER